MVFLPTAAAPDNSHERAGGNSLRWFRSLGDTHVEIVPVIDATSATDSCLAESINRGLVTPYREGRSTVFSHEQSFRVNAH